MDAIAALYGSDKSDDGGESTHTPSDKRRRSDSSSSGSDEGYKWRVVKRCRPDEDPPKWIRAFAHIDGNWPSHVKVDFPRTVEMTRMVEQIVESARRLLGRDVVLTPTLLATNEDGLHLSLSRPFVLSFDQIELFVDALRAALKWRSRFQVSLGRAVILVNDEGTRSFLALRVSSGSKHIRSLLKCVDKCMREFGLQTYYEDPIPHVSIASAHGDSLRGSLSPSQLDQLHVKDGEETRAVVRITSVQVVIGNKHFHIPLR